MLRRLAAQRLATSCRGAHSGRAAEAPPLYGRPAAEFRRAPFPSPVAHYGPTLSTWEEAVSGRVRCFSSISERDDISIEEDAERKVGWLLKLIFIGTASLVGFQFFPYMGDNLLQQSISLLHVKDPLFKRMGASRLSRYAVDDERRMKVVEMGGAQVLLNVLESAKDDKTRKEALKALVALSHSDEAAENLHQAGAVPIVASIPNSEEYAEVKMYKSSLLKKFKELNPQLEVEAN